MGLLKKRDAKYILKRLAKVQGVPVSEVRQEMESAIENSLNNPDPEVQAEFRRIFGKKTPTPEEFIVKASTKLR